MTQGEVMITMHGRSGAGKTLLFDRIRRILAEECGNRTMKPIKEASTGVETFTVTLCDEDRHQLAIGPITPEAMKLEAVEVKEGGGPYVASNGYVWTLTGNMAHGDFEATSPKVSRSGWFGPNGRNVRETDYPFVFDLSTHTTTLEAIETEDDPSFYVSINRHVTVGEISKSSSASMIIPTIDQLRALHDEGRIDTILKGIISGDDGSPVTVNINRNGAE